MRRFLVIALLILPIISSAQHSLQLDNSTYYGIIDASLLTANRSYQLPDESGILITTGSLNNLAWMLGGNTGSAPNNQLGTLDANDLNFITGGLANTRMVIDGTTGYIGMGTTPLALYPVNMYHLNTSAAPPTYGTVTTFDLQPSGPVGGASRDALHVNAYLQSSASNVATVLDGIRTDVQTFASYTGILDYAQGSNANIYHRSNTTLANADASIGSVFNWGSAATNNITTARGAAGQIWNLSTGTIGTAFAHWSRLVNNTTGSITNGYGYFSDIYSQNGGNITNAYIFYGQNAGLSAGGTITNLTGLYLQQLTAGTTNTAINYAHATSPFTVTGAGDVTVGTAVPQNGAKLTTISTATANIAGGSVHEYKEMNFEPAAAITQGTDGIRMNFNLANSAQNVSTVFDGIRMNMNLQNTYTGILDYAQGGNFNAINRLPNNINNTDALLGSTYLLGTGNMLNARGVVGQVQNVGSGTITNAYGFWSRILSLGAGSPITNGYLFYAVNPNSAGLTNLTGLYVEQLSTLVLTNARAIWYAHATRPFVVMANGEVSIGNATPTTGITLSLYPGSNGSTIQRLHRTGAGQYLSTDYQPDGVLSATNPRWATGLMGGAFQTGNYSIWRMNGAIDIPTLSMDYDGEIGVGIEPVGGVHDGKFTIQQDVATPLAGTTHNTRLVQNIALNAPTAQAFNNLYMRTNVANSASNIASVVDGIRQEVIIFPTYTGTLNYAQGGNFSVQHSSPSTLANADGVVGSIYVSLANPLNVLTNARGTVGQVQVFSQSSVTNAYGVWSRVENYGTGTITNGYLFYGNDPGATAATNITGFYQAELTGGTVRRAFHYDHATSPFVVDGSGDVGVGTVTLAGDKLTVLATGPGTLSTTSSTTDEDYAIRGQVTGDASSQAAGVWGDASNNSATNTQSIGVLATGNGNANAGETNIALQVADGEFTMGRTTETGVGYTLVNSAADGTDYSEEGPTGSIQFDLSTVTFNNNNNMVSNETRVSDVITINNRYARNGSIIMFTINDKVDEGTAPNPVNVAFTVNCVNRNNGNFVIRLYATSRNNLPGSGNPFQAGDLLRVGYMIVNPSR